MKSFKLQINGPKLDLELNLDKEKIYVGRGEDCHAHLDDPSLSRKHLVIISQHENVYIENLSSLGRVYKNDELVEYADLKPEDTVKFEDYELKLEVINESSKAYTDTYGESADEVIEAGNLEDIATKLLTGENEDVAKSEGITELGDPDLAIPELATVDVDANDDHNIDNFDDFDAEMVEPIVGEELSLEEEKNDVNQEGDELLFLNEGGESPDNSDFEEIASDMKTVVDGVEGLSAKIQVINCPGEHFNIAELAGNGEWIIGSSEECEFVLEDFEVGEKQLKLIGEMNNFSFENLNDEVNVRLNGESKTRGELKSGDYLEFGENKIQFVIVNDFSNLPTDIGILDFVNDEGSTEAAESTAIMPPAISRNPDETQNQAIPNQPFSQYQDMYESSSAPRQNSKSSKFDISKLNSKPVKIGAAIIVVLFVLMIVPEGEQAEAERAVASEQEGSRDKQGVDSETTNKVQGDFDLISQERKDEVESLYQEVLEFKSKKEYQNAYESATNILLILSEFSIENYKNTKDLVIELQEHINDVQLGNIQNPGKAIEEIKKENEESLKLLLTQGEEELRASNWDNAAEYYGQALAIDPENQDAVDGLYAAQYQIPIGKIEKELPKVKEKIKKEQQLAVEKKEDPNKKLIEAEYDKLKALELQYEHAKDKFNNGNFVTALSSFNGLKKEVIDNKNRINSVTGGGAGRLPASEGSKIVNKFDKILADIDLGVDAAIEQMDIEYKVQLEDAKAHIKNKEFSFAKNIYDQIIQSNPHYEKAKVSRGELYLILIEKAKKVYQLALIEESIGKVDAARRGYSETLSLLNNVDNDFAIQYYNKAYTHLENLQP